MKKTIFLLLLLPIMAKAQIMYLAPTLDSTTFTFVVGDSVIHHVPSFFGGSGAPEQIVLDTTGTNLWQIGRTLKPVFTNDTIYQRGIMTDTLLHYPANANAFFKLEIDHLPNCIVDVWHKYQTDSLHAGGIVEFSTDSGATWLNIVACGGLQTQNFYTTADTLLTGEPSFMGNSNGEQLSRFEFLNCVGLRTTSTVCFPDIGYYGQIYVRFRFLSDSTVSALSGWMIDSIKVEITGCGGSVKRVAQNNNFDIYPNPSTSCIAVSSHLSINQVTISNLVGQTVYSKNYLGEEEVKVDIEGLQKGIYFVNVNGVEVHKLVKE